jgi:hypothetical protein
MDEVCDLINNPKSFYVWLVALMKSTPNPKGRDPDFFFDITEESYERYCGYAIDDGNKPLPKIDGKMVEKIVMSKAFPFMPEKGRQELIKIWASIVMNSAGNGTPPSTDFIEFITYIIENCRATLPEKAVKAVRALTH